MNKHTPGPWFARCRDIGYTGGEWPEDKFLQWEVDGPAVPDGRGEYFQADARLIAAAPELLQALQALVHEYEPNLKTFALNAPRRAIWNDAEAAIAKAAGEQQ